MEAGHVGNLRIAAGEETGTTTGNVFWDSDVYKWLEAVAWEHARSSDDALLAELLTLSRTIGAAQCDDGYLNSFIQVRNGPRYAELWRSHEHYCAGHLFQAAVAAARTTGDTGLLDVATRLADHLVDTFGDLGSRTSELSGDLGSRTDELSGDLGSRTSKLSGDLGSRTGKLSDPDKRAELDGHPGVEMGGR